MVHPQQILARFDAVDLEATFRIGIGGVRCSVFLIGWSQLESRFADGPIAGLLNHLARDRAFGGFFVFIFSVGLGFGRVWAARVASRTANTSERQDFITSSRDGGDHFTPT